MLNFEKFVFDRLHLLEQDANAPAPEAPMDAGAGAPAPDQGMDPNAAPEAAPAPAPAPEAKPTSEKFAFMTSMVFDLLKYTKDLSSKFKKYSDKEIKNPSQVVPYFTMLSELLPPETKQKLMTTGFGGKTADPSDDMDDMSLMDFANTALRATFYAEKGSPDFFNFVQDIRKLTGGKITPENAEKVYDRIRTFLSMEISDASGDSV